MNVGLQREQCNFGTSKQYLLHYKVSPKNFH